MKLTTTILILFVCFGCGKKQEVHEAKQYTWYYNPIPQGFIVDTLHVFYLVIGSDTVTVHGFAQSVDLPSGIQSEGTRLSDSEFSIRIKAYSDKVNIPK